MGSLQTNPASTDTAETQALLNPQTTTDLRQGIITLGKWEGTNCEIRGKAVEDVTELVRLDGGTHKNDALAGVRGTPPAQWLSHRVGTEEADA